jgi:nucleoside-triphosphatase THEP1
MSITIKQNIKPKFDMVEMKCDKPLCKELDKYEMTKFLNSHSTNLLIGKPGSGKTSLMIAIFNKLLRGVFHNIYLFQPTHSRASMKKDIFEELPEDQKYNELTYENLLEVITTIKSDEPECNHCIIFDDMGAYLRDNEVRKLLKEIIFNRRHYHISIYFLCQTYLSLEPDIRKLFSNIFVFRVSKKELEKIFEEVVESKKEYINYISQIVWDKPHQYLFINTDSQRLFKNFDEIIIEE